MVKPKETLKRGEAIPEEKDIKSEAALSDLELAAQAQEESSEEIIKDEAVLLAAEKAEKKAKKSDDPVDYIDPSEGQYEVIRTLKSQYEDEFVYINRYGGTYINKSHIPSDMAESTKKYKNPFYKK